MSLSGQEESGNNGISPQQSQSHEDAIVGNLEHSSAGDHVEKKAVSRKTKKQSDVPSLILSRINELEKKGTKHDEEEKEIARAVKAERSKLNLLVSDTDSELDRITLLQKKYNSLFENMQKLERDHARSKQKWETTLKDHNSAKVELTRTNNMKQKLETLCRELQKENKRIKEEGKRQVETAEQKRNEMNDRFQATIREIKAKMDEECTLIGKRRVEDGELKDKFKSFLEQYQLREKHFHDVIRAKELEISVNQARAEKCRKAANDNEQRAKTLHDQVSTFSETETELRNQLNIYIEKFKQVEDTLNSSNDLFLNFRKEMETMTKKTKKLEKENAQIRSKCETANKNILDMAEERGKYRKEIDILKQKSTKLENLCRALQLERAKEKQKNNESRSEQNGANANGSAIADHKHTSDDTDKRDPGGLQEHDDSASDSFENDSEDDCSVTSFDIHQSAIVSSTPGAKVSDHVILGFLKVSEAEESLIRQKRLEFGQPAKSDPDKDQDGYLAVSAIEKDFIGAMRDAKFAHFSSPNKTDHNSGVLPSGSAELAAKVHIFSNVFTDIASRALPLDADHNLRPFTVEETQLYDEAVARLATMTQQFVDRTGEMPSEACERQLDIFRKQMPPDKLKDFARQYEQMLSACRSMVSSPETTPQTYEALMTSMAILLSANDLSELEKLYKKRPRPKAQISA